MLKPLISVVIPCHNASAWLSDCLRSVWEQKINCEVILVDDGSTDNTFERAKELTRHYAAMSVVIWQGNQGAAAARNTGLRMAQGKYVCFLDADDEYIPGYFAAAIRILDSEPTLVAADCQVELVNLHRPIEPWHINVTASSIPGNLIVRTEIARRIGGFPISSAFRGRSAGEDIEFRKQLQRCGNMARIEQKFYKYRVQPGSHFDFFVDRAFNEDGQRQVKVRSQEEMNGALAQAIRQYEDDVRQRHIADLVDKLQFSVAASTGFQALQQWLASVPANMTDVEGFALYLLAKSWPAEGRVVEIGGGNGRPIFCLACGCKEGRQGKVAVIGSPDSAPFIDAKSLGKLGLADWVELLSGGGDPWREPIRTLFIGGDHTYEAVAEHFLSWSKFLTRDALVVFQNVDVSAGITKFYGQLRANGQRWKELSRVQSLGMLQSVGHREH
jgi:glycosyltransferase involved in cell wall biosynthesis